MTFVHLAAEIVVFRPLIITENGANLGARFFLDGFESRPGFFAKLLKLPTGFFANLMHLFALGLVEAQIVVELVDIALRALSAVRTGGVGGVCYTSGIKVGNQDTGCDTDEEDCEDED